jgi:hypothetical protein
MLYGTQFFSALDVNILVNSFRSLANSVFDEYPWYNEMHGRLYFLSWRWYIVCFSGLV